MSAAPVVSSPSTVFSFLALSLWIEDSVIVITIGNGPHSLRIICRMNGPEALQQYIAPIHGPRLIIWNVGILGDRFTHRDRSPDDLPMCTPII